MPPSDATAALAAGDTAKAEALYTAQLASAPAPAYAGLVRAQIQAGEVPQALATAKAAVAALPSSALAQATLGDASLRSGQLPQASDAYKAALALDLCSPRGHFGLARIYAMTGHAALADREFGRAHNLSPDPEITAAYIENLPPDKKGPVLQAFLAQHPQLSPGRMQALTTQGGLLEQHALCTPGEPGAKATLALEPIFYGGTDVRSWGLKARLNESSTPLLELDSSVSGIILNRHDAEKAGIRPLGAATPDAPYEAVADHLRIGTLSYSGCPVRVYPDRLLGKPNSVIGLDFFRDHLIRVDYVAKAVVLAPYPASPGTPVDLGPLPVTSTSTAWTAAVIVNGNVLVPTMVNKQGPYLFGINTGSSYTLGMPAMCAATFGKSSNSTFNLHGVSSDIISVRSKTDGVNDEFSDVKGSDGKFLKLSNPVKDPVFAFAGNQAPNAGTICFDFSQKDRADDMETAGLFGFNFLVSYLLEVNYRDAQVRLLFDQNRRYYASQAYKAGTVAGR